MSNYIIAQKPVTFQFTEKDGLPDIEFYNLIEDKAGFIWLAADKGLYRYNGKEFKNFTNKDKRGLSVFEPYEDKSGRIWSLNISGQIFYTEKDSLQVFADLGEVLKGELAKFFVRDKDVLVFSSQSIYSVDKKTTKLTRLIDSDSYIGSPFYIHEKILVCINETVYEIKGNSLIRNKSLSVYPYFKENREILSSLFSLNKKLFVLRLNLSGNKERTLCVFHEDDMTNEVKIPKELEGKSLNYFYEANNLLWVCTSDGVYVYKFQNNKLILVNQYLKDIFITKFIIDINNNYWFSSLKTGVYVIPNINIKQYDFSKEYEGISCLEKINDTELIFGTTNGKAGIYNLDSNTIKPISLFSTKKVNAIAYDSIKGLVFISQEDNSSIYNNKSSKLVRNNSFINAKQISIINHNKFIYATYNGAYYISDLHKKTNVLDDELNFTRTYTSHFSAKENKSYIAYVDDLLVCQENKSTQVIRFNNKPIFAIDIAETKNGIVWISTFKDGIFGIKNNKVLYNFNETNGLVSNQTGKIKGQSDNLWIVTDKGTQLLNTQDLSFKTLTKTDGISSYNVTGIEILGSEMFFASNTGLFSLNSKKVFKEIKKPTIYLTSIDINEKQQPLKHSYLLSSEERSIKFSFNTNGFQSKEKYKYKYRLKGVSEKWIVLETGVDFVKYNSLNTGKYTFEVTFDNELYSDVKPLSIQFTIQKPYWEQWWFYFIIIALLGAFIFIYFNWKIRTIRNKQKEELQKELMSKKLVLSQLEALRSQMNPHFIFNALNSIQEYILFNNKDLASNYLIKFSRLIRIYLEHSQQNEVILKEEISALKIYLELEKIRFENILEYQLEIDKSINQSVIKIPSLFIQPYVENALKHGLLHKFENRILKVSFDEDKANENIICVIEDNGIGREASLELNKNRTKYHTSFATSANEKRLSLINLDRKNKIKVTTVDLFNESKQSSGTKIIISIPLKL
jgi:ligand-binding sensor domain-containing protein